MNPFLIDGDVTVEYSRLLSEVARSTSYFPCLQTDNLARYFTNLLKAIVADLPVTLIDSDMSFGEIPGLKADEINAPSVYSAPAIRGIDDLIERVKNSKAEIAIFTSGTTGQPKKVTHSVATLTRSVRIGQRHRSDIWAFAYNPTHMAGLQVFFQALLNKNTLVNIFRKASAEIRDAIAHERVTHISATPTFYRMLLPAVTAFPAVIRVTLGGEKSDSQLYAQISKLFPSAKINNVYASTEAGSLFAAKGDCFMLPADAEDKFKVVDGELLIHKSLLGISDSFEFDGDYYHSGDLIEWVDGFETTFRFAGRKNELINVGGYKVNPAEVEAAIMRLGGIVNAKVYGKPNSVLGNVLCADIVKEAESELAEVELKLKLRQTLQDFKVPRRIKFVDRLSTTRTGKIKRQNDE